MRAHHFLRLVLLSLLLLSCSGKDIKKEQASLLLEQGTHHIIKGNYAKAENLLLDAESLDPQNAVTKNNLGLVYFAKHDLSNAEDYFNKALLVNSQYSDARNNLARVYIELARYNEAISELTSVLKDSKYTSMEKAHINLGLAYQKRGDSPSALIEFKKAIDANPRFCPAYNFYGQGLFSAQKYDEALESFETALKLCNNIYDEAHYYRALSLYKIGKTEKAIQQWQDIVKLYPGSDSARKSKHMLQLMRPEQKR